MLMIYAAADRYLRPAGRLAMILTQTVFQTRGAGDGFRRFRLGEAGEHLRVLRVNDMVDARPFAGAANWTASLVLEKGRPTSYPVPYVKYAADRTSRDFEAVPIDAHRPTSPWMLWPRGWSRSAAAWIGPADYKAHLGANTGGANGVYWMTLCDESPGVASAAGQGSPSVSPVAPPGLVRVRNIADRGKHVVSTEEAFVESDLLYPLLRWGDIGRYRAVAAAHLLLAQDPHSRRGIAESVMQNRHPMAYAYLTQFRGLLERRAAYRRYQSQAAFYSMYDVGPYTLAPVKVVWRRMDRRINAAVVEPVDDVRLGPRPVIPQETCVLVAVDSVDEAHYLCAVLNSAIAGFVVSSHSVCGGKSFGSPGMLDYLAIRRYDATHAVHRKMSQASRRAHHAAAAGRETAAIQHDIDRLAMALWGLRPEDIPQATASDGRA